MYTILMREEPFLGEGRGSRVIPRGESLKKERVYVSENKEQYIDIEPETAGKVETLLKSQEDVRSHDIEAVFKTSDKIQGANCHKTALYLTDQASLDDLFEPNNTDPQYAGHEQVEANTKLFTSYDDFKNALMREKFPIRISFFKPKDGKENYAHHSITILGFSNKKTLVGFEKAGPYPETPFRFVNALKLISKQKRFGYTPGIEN